MVLGCLKGNDDEYSRLSIIIALKDGDINETLLYNIVLN